MSAPVASSARSSRKTLWIASSLAIACIVALVTAVLLYDSAAVAPMGAAGSPSPPGSVTPSGPVMPQEIAGRARVTGARGEPADDLLKGLLHDFAGSSISTTGVYGDDKRKTTIVLASVTATSVDPTKDLDKAFSGMRPAEGRPNIGITVTGLQKVDAGPLGGTAKCGTGDLGGERAAVCGWADKGSVGLVVFFFHSKPAEVKADFLLIRSAAHPIG